MHMAETVFAEEEEAVVVVLEANSADMIGKQALPVVGVVFDMKVFAVVAAAAAVEVAVEVAVQHIHIGSTAVVEEEGEEVDGSKQAEKRVLKADVLHIVVFGVVAAVDAQAAVVADAAGNFQTLFWITNFRYIEYRLIFLLMVLVDKKLPDVKY